MRVEMHHLMHPLERWKLGLVQWYICPLHLLVIISSSYTSFVPVVQWYPKGTPESVEEPVLPFVFHYCKQIPLIVSYTISIQDSIRITFDGMYVDMDLLQMPGTCCSLT
jgi:lipid-A-disaccharide synthase-like uncharacterized protein